MIPVQGFGNIFKPQLRRHKLLIRIFIVVLGLVIIILFLHFTIPMELWYSFISWLKEWQSLIGTIISIAFSPLVLIYLYRWNAKRQEQQALKERYPLRIENLSIEELKARLLKSAESYIKDDEREEFCQVKSYITSKRPPRYILIYGSEGVGKTREAIEIIERLEKSEPEEKNIYLVQSLGFPTVGPIKGNAVLLFDDLCISKGVPVIPDEEKLLPSPTEFIEMIIDFFEKSPSLNSVIITMTTKEHILLKRLSPTLFNKFKIIIECKELSFQSKCFLIGHRAKSLKLNISETLIKKFAEVPIKGSIKAIERFLFEKSRYKTVLDLEDFEEYRARSLNMKEELLEDLRQRNKNESLLFDILSQFYQFSIPAFMDIVEKIWCSKVGRFFLKRRKFKEILEKYDGQGLRIKEKRIYPDDFWLSLKAPDDLSLKNDLKELAKSFESLMEERNYENYLLFSPLSHELHKHGLYGEAIKFYDYILNLPEGAFPQNINLKKLKSNYLFYKGHAYYSLGKKFWNKAENCYRESIKLNELNLFAKHALATLLWKRGDFVGALKFLNEITDTNKRDLLAYKTKLDIYTDIGDTDSEGAKKTYKEIEDLIKNNSSFSQELIFSTKLALTRFLAKKGEILKEQGKSKEAEDHFNKVAIPQFESLISEIPPELNELKAIVKNAYGCLLYDVLEKIDDGTTQLEGAYEIFPKHKHTLHKLVTIYIKKGEENPVEKEKYWKKARTYLTELLDIDKEYPQALRSKAELDGKDIDWGGRAKSVEQGNLSKSEFWQEVYEIFKEYQDALEKEEAEYPSLHNGIVHHSAGWFLWNIEMKAKKFIQSKSPLIPSADVEFRKSIEIEQKFKDKDFPREVKKHLLIAYDTLSSYLQMTGRFRKDPNMVKKSYFYSNKTIELSNKWKIKFHSENSYNESYIAKLLLDEGEVDEAIERFKRAIAICPNNLMAWFGLEESYEKKGNYRDALQCLENIAKIKNRPDTYGTIRNTAKRWMKEGKIPKDMRLLHSYSKKAYELDPTGAIDSRNVSDYAYDNLKIGKIEGNEALLKEGKRLYMGLIKQTLCRIDENPDEEFLYTLILRSYCPPIWKSGQKLDNEIMMEIENCAKRRSNPFANKMAGITLQRNGECSKALPYLEKAPKDVFVLKSLMKCYEALGKREKVEEVAKELANLLAKKKEN
jgi:Tfp pilus assembly protein PilF